MSIERGWRSGLRVQQAGLLLVVFLLGLTITLAGGTTTVDGREVNNFFRLDNLVPNVATTMSWIAIMAVGATIVIAAGGIDISIGSIYGLAALATAAVLQTIPEDAWAIRVLPAAFLTAIGVGAACGLLNGLIVVGLRMHPFVVTLGTLSIFRGIALIAVPTKSLPSGDHSLPQALTRDFVSWRMEIPRAGLPPMLLEPAPMLIMLACVAAVAVFLRYTIAGRKIYAVGGNEEAARYSGIAVGRVKVLVYVLSGACAGLAGLVSTGYYGAASTATGEGYELMVIAAAVVGGASLSGGRGTALGALLGTLIIKLIDNATFILKSIDLGFTSVPVSKEYSKIVIGVSIILAVAVDRLSEHWQNRRAASASRRTQP